MEEIQKVQALKEKIISLIENASNVNELKTVQETHLSKKSELNLELDFVMTPTTSFSFSIRIFNSRYDDLTHPMNSILISFCSPKNYGHS